VQSNGTKAQLQQRLLSVFGLITPAPHATAALLYILALERSTDPRVQTSKVYELFIRDENALYMAEFRRCHSVLPDDVVHWIVSDEFDVRGITLSNSPHSYCLTA
jgi:hypothetical protein